MPILIYFKNPPMSLMLKGKINKAYVRKLKRAFSNVLEMEKPDGLPIVLIGHADCDLSYVSEITQEEMDNMIKENKAAVARSMAGGDKITPVSGIPGRKFTGRPQ